MSLSVEALNNIGIRQWSDLKDKHRNLDILLGNGFSINMSDKFRYSSIYQQFETECEDEHKFLFREFHTTNFEYIMEMLINAGIVNKAFSLDVEKIRAAIQDLKEGLIKSINVVRPHSGEIHWGMIDNLANQFVSEFKDVYTTNYDLLIYHIIMASCDRRKAGGAQVALQDYFWGDYTSDKKEFVDYQAFRYYNHVYYLHGSLCVFTSGTSTYKLIKAGRETELIDLIANEIRHNRLPVFVSEGTAEDKEKAVYRNHYLRFCFDKLKRSPNPLCVYGLSLAANDQHIVDRIKARPRPLIVSIYPEGKNELELNSEKIQMLLKFGNDYGKEIDFVDSRSVFVFD